MKDKELVDAIAQIQNGSQKAQTKLINYFWDDVFGFILKKVQDRTIADELTVAVFAKILTKLNLYDENFQFKTWILTIAQNSVIDYWRKKSREEVFTDDFKDVKNEFEKSPEELLISKQQQQHRTEILRGKKHKRNCRNSKYLGCKYKSENNESKKNIGRIIKKRIKIL